MTLRALIHDPTLRVAALAAVLVVLGARLRPKTSSYLQNEGIPSEQFWAEKAQISHSIDIALIGDSRVFRGLSPAELKSRAGDLHDARIANLAFSSVALSDPYLTYVEDALDPSSSKKTIVVGVTAHEFTEHANIDNGYLEERRRNHGDVWERLYLSPIRDELRPITIDDIRSARANSGNSSPHYYQYFQAAGFVASDLTPQAPDHALREYAAMFAQSTVDESRVAFFVDRVRAWKTRGIRVIGFRPPTSQAMSDLESSAGHFDEARVRAAFIAAGGEWLTINPSLYQTYDGSHLRADDAKKLSRDLIAQLTIQK